MKTDKTKLLQDIEAMKEKLASMEKELNKAETFKHFPSEDDEYFQYNSMGDIWSDDAFDDDLKVNVFKTQTEAEEAYSKAVALEKIKRRIVELQGDWKPNWKVDDYKQLIIYRHNRNRFEVDEWASTSYPILIPYMKTSDIANTIIKEMEDELKLIFDIA